MSIPSMDGGEATGFPSRVQRRVPGSRLTFRNSRRRRILVVGRRPVRFEMHRMIGIGITIVGSCHWTGRHWRLGMVGADRPADRGMLRRNPASRQHGIPLPLAESSVSATHRARNAGRHVADRQLSDTHSLAQHVTPEFGIAGKALGAGKSRKRKTETQAL
jgi:hypothetical protein